MSKPDQAAPPVPPDVWRSANLQTPTEGCLIEAARYHGGRRCAVTPPFIVGPRRWRRQYTHWRYAVSTPAW